MKHEESVPYTYTLSEVGYRILLNKGHNLVCHLNTCQQRLLPGDQIVSRKQGSHGHVKRYHKKCWESTFH